MIACILEEPASANYLLKVSYDLGSFECVLVLPYGVSVKREIHFDPDNSNRLSRFTGCVSQDVEAKGQFSL